MKVQTDGILSSLIQDIRLKKIIRHIRGKNILDVGCGNAKLVEMIPSNIYYLGIDKNPPNKKTFKKNNIRFLQINLEKNFSLDGKFDTIILAAVLEHLKDPLIVVKKLLLNLNKNGKIIITTPTKFGIILHKWLSFFRLTSQEAAHQHKEGLSKENFLEFEKIFKMHLIKYQRFLLGLNQLVIFEKSD